MVNNVRSNRKELFPDTLLFANISITYSSSQTIFESGIKLWSCKLQWLLLIIYNSLLQQQVTKLHKYIINISVQKLWAKWFARKWYSIVISFLICINLKQNNKHEYLNFTCVMFHLLHFSEWFYSFVFIAFWIHHIILPLYIRLKTQSH